MSAIAVLETMCPLYKTPETLLSLAFKDMAETVTVTQKISFGPALTTPGHYE